jgi:transposase-like protein
MHSTSSEPAPTDSAIIRAGSDGRLRFTPAQRQELLDAYNRSGLTAMAFARGHGVCYQTFIAWQRKRREQATLPTTRSGPAFAEVLVTDLHVSGVPSTV